MNFHIFGESALCEDLDPIKESFDLVAKSFKHNAPMTGVFSGSCSESLITGCIQNIVSIAPEIKVQYHIFLSKEPAVENLSRFAGEMVQCVNAKPDDLAAIGGYGRESLSGFFGRELTDSEAVVATMFLIGGTITHKNIRLGEGYSATGVPFNFIVMRYDDIVKGSPADVIVREILSGDLDPSLFENGARKLH